MSRTPRATARKRLGEFVHQDADGAVFALLNMEAGTIFRGTGSVIKNAHTQWWLDWSLTLAHWLPVSRTGRLVSAEPLRFREMFLAELGAA